MSLTTSYRLRLAAARIAFRICGLSRIQVTWAKEKDAVENETHKLVCDGQMNLADAQKAAASNWVSFGKQEGVIP